MSSISTGVSALSLEDTGLTCAGYYSDTTYLSFTNDGNLAVVQNSDTLFSTPLAGINLPITNWSSSQVQLLPNSDPYVIETSMCGDWHKVRQLTDIDISFLYELPGYKYAKLVIEDEDGQTRETDFIDISNIKTAAEFKSALSKALSDAELDLEDTEIYSIGEHIVTMRTCKPGVKYTYKLNYYNSAKELVGTNIGTANPDRPDVEYESARPSFMLVTVTYNGDSGSSGGCSCKSNSKCGGSNSSANGGCKPVNMSSSSLNNANSSDGKYYTMKWTNADLYAKLGDVPEIWDTIGSILIHSGAANLSEDDDNGIRPIVLKNTSGVTANVKILMAL